MNIRRSLLQLALLGVPFAFLAAASPARAEDPGQKILENIDQQQRVAGNLKALFFIEETQKDRKVVREALVYRRDKGRRFLMLMTSPKSEEGSGYLRLDNNLWFYEPKTGKWDRRTEREQLGGTNVRRSDLDDTYYAEEYDVVEQKKEKLGPVVATKLVLKAKPNVDVAYPVVHLWVDSDFKRMKLQEFALSGKLLRTIFMARHGKVPTANGHAWLPKEVRIFDEVEKDRQTVLLFKAYDLAELETNLFTKAWLEGKTR